MASISDPAPGLPERELASRYGRGAAFLHWLIAGLILAQIGIGCSFELMERGPGRAELFLWHKAVGVTILLLALVRLGWRLSHRPPPFPPELPAWQRVLATLNHWLFYILMIALPLTGLIAVSDGARSGWVRLQFGLHVPAVPGISKEVGDASGEVHALLVFTTLALLALHVAAAIRHQYFDRGRMAGRMPPLPPAD